MQTETTMATIISDIGTFLTAAVGWMGDVAAFVVSEPIILLLAVVVPLSGWAISGLRRLININ